MRKINSFRPPFLASKSFGPFFPVRTHFASLQFVGPWHVFWVEVFGGKNMEKLDAFPRKKILGENHV